MPPRSRSRRACSSERALIRVHRDRTQQAQHLFIILFFIAFIGAIGLLAGWLMGNNWWVTAFILIFAAGYAVFQYFFADKEALAMSGAVEVGRRPTPRATSGSSRTCPSPPARRCRSSTSSTTPRRTPSRPVATPSSRRSRSRPASSSSWTDRELEGVLAHELGHVRNYDIRVSLLVFGLVVAVGILADMFLRVAFFGRRGSNSQSQVVLPRSSGSSPRSSRPCSPALVQAAISRQREYLADATSAMTTRASRRARVARWRSSRSSGRPMRRAEHLDGAPVDRRSAQAQRHRPPVRDPPADPRADRAPPHDGRRVLGAPAFAAED